MITKENFSQHLPSISVKELPADIKELHEFAVESSDGGRNWDAYADETVRPVIDHYFKKLNEFLSSKKETIKSEPEKKSQAKKLSQSEHFVDESKKREIKAVKDSESEDKQESDLELVEKIPEEIRFIRRYLSLHGKKKSKDDLLKFINAMHRAIVEKRIRKTSPFAKQMNYIQDKLVKKYNEKWNKKLESLVLTDKTLTEFKEIVSSFKVMPSVNFIKRYISLNGKFGMKEKAALLAKAMKTALDKGRVSKADKYRKLFDRMLSNLNKYVSERSQKALVIEESELNGLQGLTNDSELEDNSSLDSVKTKGAVMSVDEARKSTFETIGLQGPWLQLIGNACKPTHLFVSGPGGGGKSAFMLRYCEYLNGLGQKVLYIAGEQYGTPTFTELLNILDLRGDENFELAADFGERNPDDYDFVAFDSKDSLEIGIEEFRLFKRNHKKQSTITSSQSTKAGDFTGSGQWRNEVDTMVYCEGGVAKTLHDKNRWGGNGEMKIFN